MKLLITRPVAITGEGGVRSFAPGIAVEVDAATAAQILERQAGIPAEPAAPAPAPAPAPAQPETPATPRRRRRPANART